MNVTKIILKNMYYQKIKKHVSKMVQNAHHLIKTLAPDGLIQKQTNANPHRAKMTIEYKMANVYLLIKLIAKKQKHRTKNKKN